MDSDVMLLALVLIPVDADVDSDVTLLSVVLIAVEVDVDSESTQPCVLVISAAVGSPMVALTVQAAASALFEYNVGSAATNGAAPDQKTPIDVSRLYSSPLRLPSAARRRTISAGAAMRACKYLPRPLRPTRMVIFVMDVPCPRFGLLPQGDGR